MADKLLQERQIGWLGMPAMRGELQVKSVENLFVKGMFDFLKEIPT